MFAFWSSPFGQCTTWATTCLIVFSLGAARLARIKSNFRLCLHFYSTTSAYINCEIMASPEEMEHRPYAFGFQKNSPFHGIFSYYIDIMRERGTLEQIKKKYLASKQVCPDTSGQPLGFAKCYTAFIALVIGTCSGLIIMLMEQCVTHRGIT